jgi:hypothetical protein
LSFAISFVDTTTNRTLTRRVAWVNIDHRHTAKLCLVIDKLTQLVKRPAMQTRTLRLSSRDPVADTRQIFEGNTASSALSLFYKFFTDRVVNVLGKTLFFTRQFLEATARSKSAFTLQLLAQATVTITHVLNLRTGVHLPIAVYRDVGNTQVNTEKPIRVKGCFVGHIAGRKQVELAFAVDQIAFTLLKVQKRKLMFSGHKVDFLPPAHKPDRNVSLINAPVQNPTVVGHSTEFLEITLGFFVQLVSINYLANTAHGQLSRQIEPRPNFAICQAMYWNAAKSLFLPRHITDVIASGIGLLKCFKEQAALRFGRLKFHYGGQFHSYIIAYLFEIFKMLKGEGAYLPMPKGRGFSRQN